MKIFFAGGVTQQKLNAQNSFTNEQIEKVNYFQFSNPHWGWLGCSLSSVH